MAISPVLASAILNQRAPDLVGKFRQGQEIGRQEKIRGLAGAASQGQQGALEELRGLDPELALKLGEGLRANTAADINDTIRDTRFVNAQLAAGDIQGAEAFLEDRLQRLQSQGRDFAQTQNILGKIRTAPNEAFAETQKFLSVLDGAKDSERTAAIQNREALFEILDDPGASEDRKRAARIELGLEPRAGISAAERIAGDPDLTTAIAGSQAEIAGRKASSSERAKLLQQAQFKPSIAADVAASESEEQRRQALQKGVFGDARAARKTLSEVGRLRTALEGVKTGRIAAARQALGGLIPGIRDADAEQINSAVNEFVLRRKDELLGGGILSDADIALLQGIGPQLGSTTEANLGILRRFEEVSNAAVDRAIRLRDFEGDVLDFEIEPFVRREDVPTATGPGGQEPPSDSDQPQVQFLGFE